MNSKDKPETTNEETKALDKPIVFQELKSAQRERMRYNSNQLNIALAEAVQREILADMIRREMFGKG